MNRIRLAVALVGLTLAIGAISVSGTIANEKGAPTFSKDVAPIFYKNCIDCHRPGEIAPMSFVSYKEVRPWARSIREKVVSREMPPWHADASHGQWANDRRLSQKEIDTISAWVEGGAKEGDVRDLPKQPKLSSGWQIGEPDAVFHMPTEYTVPAEGAVPYQYFTVDPGFKEDRYVHAMEARAGNLSVVHHIVLYVREPGNQQRPRRVDIGTDLLGALSPGQTPFVARPGTAKLIKAGSKLVFQLHYTPNGKETKDKSYVGFIFAKKPVDKVITTSAAFDTRFVIPPGAQNYEIKAAFEFEQDSHIISLMPHMHLRGKDITYKAVYPDGRSEILLAVPRYNFAWQVYYYPTKPLPMPKGTRIEAVAHYDNSTRNPQNPDPGKAVRFGEQTWDEMMNAFFDYTVDSQSGVSASQGSVGRTDK